MPASYARHRVPSEVIQHAVWLYLRFTLSYRDVEELLAERGVEVSYETVRRWVCKFGNAYARQLRRTRGKPSPRWHLDEMVVRICGKHLYLWRPFLDPHRRRIFRESRASQVPTTASGFSTPRKTYRPPSPNALSAIVSRVGRSARLRPKKSGISSPRSSRHVRRSGSWIFVQVARAGSASPPMRSGQEHSRQVASSASVSMTALISTASSTCRGSPMASASPFTIAPKPQ